MNWNHRANRAAYVVEAMESRLLLSVSLVKDIVPGPQSSNPFSGVAAGQDLFFFAADSATASTPSLFKTDGTPAGTVELRKVSQYTQNLQPVNDNGTLYYVESDGGTHGLRLWKSDGTAAGTVPAADLGLGANAQLTVVGTILYFVEGTDVWKTDPTSNSAVKAFTVPDQYGPPMLGTYAGKLLVDDWPGQLYAYDGASLTPIGPAAIQGHLENQSEGRIGADVLGGTLYYLGLENLNGSLLYTPVLYRSDGSPNGATVVKTFTPFASGDSYPLMGPWTAGGKLLFSLNDQLYASDGTASGTVLVSSHLVLANGRSAESVNGQEYFVALDSARNFSQELWKTDGAPSGTTMLLDGVADQYAYDPLLTAYDGKIYFTAPGQNNPAIPDALWETDGTPAGTRQVAGIAYPSTPASPTRAAAIGVAGGSLYFSAPDPTVGNELFTLNATPQPQPLQILGTRGDDAITLSVSGTTVRSVVNGIETNYSPAQYAGGIVIDTGLSTGSGDLLNILGLPPVAAQLQSEGPLSVYVGDGHVGMQAVAATTLTIGAASATQGKISLTLDDGADSTTRSVTLDAATFENVPYGTVTGLSAGTIAFNAAKTASPLTIYGGGGGNAITVNDTPAGPNVNLSTGAGNDTVTVNATAAGTVLNVNGKSGADTVNVDGDVRGVVNVSNSVGATTLNVWGDGANVVLDTFAAPGDTYGTIQGLPGEVNFSGKGVNVVDIIGYMALQTVVVNNTPDNGTIYIDGAFFDATVNGVAAGESLRIQGEEGLVYVDFSTGRVLGHVDEFGMSDVFVIASPSQSFTDIPVGFDGTDTVEVTLSGGTYTFGFDLADTDNWALNLYDTHVIAQTSQTLAALNLGDATMTLLPGANLSCYGLGLDGTLDIGVNQVTFTAAPPPAQLRSWIVSGLAGGKGITSSAVDAHHTVAYSQDAVRWTYFGDANLDGSVNFDDLLALAQNYGRTDADWTQGDFNYDGSVNFADLLLLAPHYGASLAPAAAATPLDAPVSDASILGKPNRARRWLPV